MKPFTTPTHHQPDTGEKESAQYAGKNNDRARVAYPSKETMHHTVEHGCAGDGSPEDTGQIMEPDITPEPSLNAEGNETNTIDGQYERKAQEK